MMQLSAIKSCSSLTSEVTSLNCVKGRDVYIATYINEGRAGRITGFDPTLRLVFISKTYQIYKFTIRNNVSCFM